MLTLDRLANIQIGVGVGSIFVGLLLVLAPGTEVFRAYERDVVDAILGAGAETASTSRLMHWLLATCGAGVVGWGVSWCFIAHFPLRDGERWAFSCLLTSLAAWVALDIAVAAWFGVRAELLFVSVAAVLAGGPLVLARRLFH